MDPVILARELSAMFSDFSQVKAVAMGGSHGLGGSDAYSDIDLYVYVTSEIPADLRVSKIEPRATRLEIDNRFWETGDEWTEKGTGVTVDAMYRDPKWIEEQLQRSLIRYEASVGYSTCFWSNVLNSRALYDPDGWFASLQQFSNRPYPDELRRAIVRKNHPVLRRNISSFYNQIRKAIDRSDSVSIHHRTAAILASWFDIVFAVNRIPHPGEKRLLQFLESRCAVKPAKAAENIQSLLTASPDSKLQFLDKILDPLDEILISEALL